MNMNDEQLAAAEAQDKQEAAEGIAKGISRLGWDLRFGEKAVDMALKLLTALEQVGEEEAAAEAGEEEPEE